MLKLQKITRQDANLYHAMQVRAFQPLLDEYQDVKTNPAADSLQKVEERLSLESSSAYFIRFADQIVGALRLVRAAHTVMKVSPLFILPEFQGRGYAQQAMMQAEIENPEITEWVLDTIKEEKYLCRLYERLGYVPTGREEKLQPGMTLIYYQKKINRC